MESYEKKYNKAQKWIESIYSELSHEQQMEAVAFFPELRESEDELTWLTKYIKEEAYSLSMDIRDNEDRIKLKNLQRSLDWLEKQSSNVDNANKEYWRGYREGKQEFADKYAELEKQGEQKSAWSEEDEKMVANLVDYFKVDDALQYTEKQVVDWLKSLKQRIKGE